jgi:hypothetical protein
VASRRTRSRKNFAGCCRRLTVRPLRGLLTRQWNRAEEAALGGLQTRQRAIRFQGSNARQRQGWIQVESSHSPTSAYPAKERGFPPLRLTGWLGVINKQPRREALGRPPVVNLWHAWGVARGALNYVQRALDGMPLVS